MNAATPPPPPGEGPLFAPYWTAHALFPPKPCPQLFSEKSACEKFHNAALSPFSRLGHLDAASVAKPDIYWMKAIFVALSLFLMPLLTHAADAPAQEDAGLPTNAVSLHH